MFHPPWFREISEMLKVDPACCNVQLERTEGLLAANSREWARMFLDQ
jgi:hypothetical protein